MKLRMTVALEGHRISDEIEVADSELEGKTVEERKAILDGYTEDFAQERVEWWWEEVTDHEHVMVKDGKTFHCSVCNKTAQDLKGDEYCHVCGNLDIVYEGPAEGYSCPKCGSSDMDE